MAAGYIYVMVNSSMPGLVKVGKTTRNPSQRAEELSGVTGVATPFILAFEKHFFDCDAAEAHVHAVLERKGFRESRNREFFRAPASEVVQVVVELDSGVGRQQMTATAEQAFEDGGCDLLPANDDVDEFGLDDLKPRAPWADLIEKADELFYGFGDTLEDHEAALTYYMDAARLGSSLAYQQIGRIYCDSRNDHRRAIEFYKEGFRRGNYFCMAEMAVIFLFEDHLANAEKCWRLFFEGRRCGIVDEVEEYPGKLVSFYKRYIEYCTRQKKMPDYISDMAPVAQEVIERLENSRRDERFSDEYRALCFRALDVAHQAFSGT